MPIDAYASASHYLSHIAPIWKALPPSERGTFYVKTSLVHEANLRNIPVNQAYVRRAGNPIIVASYSDYLTSGHREVIFVEHGAGQTYKSAPNHRAYSGGRHRERVILFICPSERVANNNRAVYPHIPTAIVGCPRLDPLHIRSHKPRSNPPLVAVTFHADYNVVPETQSSFRYFLPMIEHLINAGYDVLGHGHPNIYRRLARTYDRYGIMHSGDADYILLNADVLCVDNSSLMYEFASMNKPVVALNAPFYRRDVHHGLRFWSHIPGPQCDGPDEIVAKVAEALHDDDGWPERREEILRDVYAFRDGTAAARAASAIVAATDQDGAYFSRISGSPL